MCVSVLMSMNEDVHVPHHMYGGQITISAISLHFLLCLRCLIPYYIYQVSWPMSFQRFSCLHIPSLSTVLLSLAFCGF